MIKVRQATNITYIDLPKCGYPGRDLDIDKFKKIFLRAKHRDNKIVIDRREEPMLFWRQPDPGKNEGVSIFHFFHTLCDDTGFSKNNVLIQSNNPYVEQCYTDWCAYYQLTPELRVMFFDHWAVHIGAMVKHQTVLFTEPKQRYFTCHNVHPRLHKLNVASWFYKNNKLTDEFIAKNYMSFAFPEVESRQTFLDANPGILDVLPRSLEQQQGNSFIYDDEPLNSTVLQTLHDSFFDVAIEFIECEDYDNMQYYNDTKQQCPWWRETIISEKIYKNIYMKRPFLVAGDKHVLSLLHSFGFKTFNRILFDESYDLINSYTERLNAVLTQAVDIVEQNSITELQAKINSDEVQSVLEHNFNVLDQIKQQHMNNLLHTENIFNGST